jgi:hypothetical protein
MSDSIDPADWVALMQLGARYWACADGDATINISDLFTEDGELVLGTLELAGNAAIERFFREREATQKASQRITRHVATNHLLVRHDATSAVVRCTVTVFAGAGSLPLPSAVPTGIADFEDLLVRARVGADWRFKRRSARSVFIGPGAAAFAR